MWEQWNTFDLLTVIYMFTNLMQVPLNSEMGQNPIKTGPYSLCSYTLRPKLSHM